MSREPVAVRELPDGASLVVGPDEAGARIEWRGAEHAILEQAPEDGGTADWSRTRVVLGPARRRAGSGVLLREVLVNGWLVEVELEAERRATLRTRARRASAGGQGEPDGEGGAAARSGQGRPTELRADLPGRIAAISVEPGDTVTAGQPLLVIEAMKMLNELRAPRAGVVELVAVAVGRGVELGDLLVRLR